MKLRLLFVLFSLVGIQLDAAPTKPWPRPSAEMQWKVCETSFREFQKYKPNKTSRYLIPKIAHFVLLGDELSAKNHRNIETFRRLHPKWQIKIWTDESLDALNMVNKQAFENATSIERKIAIVSYEALNQFGGVSLSPLFTCIRSFDELNQSCEFFTVCSDEPRELSPDVIGARPHHPIILACQRDAARTKRSSTSMLTRNFLALAWKFHGRAVALPYYYFPWCFPGYCAPEHNTKITPDTFAALYVSGW